MADTSEEGSFVRRYGVTAIAAILAVVAIVAAYNLVMNRLRQEVAAGIVLGVQTALQDSASQAAVQTAAMNLIGSQEMKEILYNAAFPIMGRANSKIMYALYMFNAFSRDVFGKEFKPFQEADLEKDGRVSIYGGEIKLGDYQFVPKKTTPATKAEAPQEGEKTPAAEPSAPQKKLTW